ncbi:ATP-binding protein [Paenibacillus sp. TRM 82003]|nr:ATP-binding protein [Paenibacillus sp. TRM 82003]
MFEHSPVPFFTVARDFEILSRSESSLDSFPPAHNFMELVDPESRPKATRVLRPGQSKPIKTELNLLTNRQPLSLFQIFVEWTTPERANVVCIEQEERMDEIRSLILGLRELMADTDFMRMNRQAQLEEELKLLREITKRSDKVDMLGDIAAGIAHEIRNPLTTVRGFIQLLRPYLSQLGKGEYAELVLSDINRANDIINMFINSSRPSAPIRRHIPATRLIRRAIGDVAAEAEACGCEIVFQPPAATLSLFVDGEQVRQALCNILRNAIDAVQRAERREAGVIRVEAFQEAEGVRIRINDNGTGMDKGTISRAVLPFFTTKDDALGLGLATSCRIIENHGGTLEVESRIGEGSTIDIYLYTMN